MVTDDELSKLAEQALLQEAKRGAIRAEISGPSGWLKSKLPSTNKKFLHNTLLGALAANRVKEERAKNQSEIGKRKRELKEKEKNTYKKVYIHASTKPKTAETKKYFKSNVSEPDIIKTESKNQVIWSDSGLEFTNSKKVNKDPDLLMRHSEKGKLKDHNITLPRNITFVSGKNTKRLP
ncbi:hypothetical protein SK128_005805 [Halocaridina rubra]|uniref:Uncharacterized protein n=1 Tax=Halocaridina rubra TaxID=373956 RepID=A0AAN8XVY5_HALRR